MNKPSIFKAYDIRGVYPDEINKEVAYKTGRAIAKFFNCKNIAVGYDMRKSSPIFFDELTRGLVDEGVEVTDIGLCATPMLHFTVAKFGYDAGIMISASHNPAKYNGFKIDGKGGIQISGDTGIQEIEKIFCTDKFEDKDGGKIIKKDVLEDYIKHILNFAGNIQDLKIVVDYGNGVGAISAKLCQNKILIPKSAIEKIICFITSFFILYF